MAYTHIQHGSNADDSSSTAVVTTTLSGNVGAGHLVAVWMKWEGTDAVPTLTGAGGGAWVSRPRVAFGGFLYGCFGYLLVAGGGASSVTMTLDSNQGFKRLQVWEFSYTGTASFQVEGNDFDHGGATRPLSLDISPTGSDLVALGSYGESSAFIITTLQINGVAPDASIVDSPAGTYTASWYRILTSGFTNGHANGTWAGGNAGWLCGLIVFDATAAGSSSFTPIPGAPVLAGVAPSRSIGTVMTPVTP